MSNIIKIAHVGTLNGPADQARMAVVLEYMYEKYPSYLNGEVNHDDINLKWKRDYLEINDYHNIVILHFLFAPNAHIPENVIDFHSISKHHTPENWNKKLNESKADFIFVFGLSHCEVNSFFFGQLSNYEYKLEPFDVSGVRKMEVFIRKDMKCDCGFPHSNEKGITKI